MIYQFIDENKDIFGLRWLFRHFNMAPNAYYNFLKDNKAGYRKQKSPICQTYAKEKHCNLKKRLQRFLNPVQFQAGHSYSPSFSTSEISFAVAVTIRMPVSLIPSRSASSCRRCVFFSGGVSKRNWSTDIL